jgi:molecular chaperone DnaJ
VDVSVPFSVATLGGKIQIPVVGGAIEQTIPEGTQSGHILRLRGKGVTSRNGQTGDLYINVSVEMPKKLTKEQKELFKKLNVSPQTTDDQEEED